jgi:hypothetical protein
VPYAPSLMTTVLLVSYDLDVCRGFPTIPRRLVVVVLAGANVSQFNAPSLT